MIKYEKRERKCGFKIMKIRIYLFRYLLQVNSVISNYCFYRKLARENISIELGDRDWNMILKWLSGRITNINPKIKM